MPEAGIAVVTLLDTSGYRAAALAAGADDFVSKTKANTALLPAIRRPAASVDCVYTSIVEEETDG